jgi:long-chain fatty acid transport protein
MKHYLRSSLCALGAVLLTARLAFADGIVRDSVEATSGGRGGTNIANSDNGGVLLSNPAGILNSDGEGLAEIGFDTLITDIHFSNPLNDDVGAHTRPLELPMLSYWQKSDDGRWAAGIGIFAPAGFAAGWDLNNAVEGNKAYQSFGALVKVLPAFAYRVTDKLTVGATVGVAFSYAELETPFYLQSGPFAGTPVHMQLKGDGFAPTWSLGLQYQLTESTMLGVAYTSEDRFELDGHMQASVYGLGPQPVPARFDARTNIVWPQSVGVGIRQQVTERQRVSMDVLWYDWAHAMKSVDVELTNASNPLFTSLLGPDFHNAIPMDWWDSVSVRFGYEWFYSDMNILRAGYVYNSPQIPSSNLTPLIPATLEHTFTIGHGTTFDNNWRLDFAYQFAFGPERQVGTSALAGGDFSNSTITAQAHWISLSLTHTF